MKIRRIDWYPDDWLAGTIGLDAQEVAVYITVCMLIYSVGGPIREELVKRQLHMHGTMLKRCLAKLETLGKIIRNEGEIDQKRCENELERARKRIENGKENARKRWNSKGLADGVALRIPYANNQQPTTNIQHPTDSEEVVEESCTNTESKYESPNPTTRLPARNRKYVFYGKLIRLTGKDFNSWQAAYHGIPDLKAELTALDDFYDETLVGDVRKRWYMRCSAALDKKHQTAIAASKRGDVAASGYWPMPSK